MKGSPEGELAPKVTERGDYVKALSVTLMRATSPKRGGFRMIATTEYKKPANITGFEKSFVFYSFTTRI